MSYKVKNLRDVEDSAAEHGFSSHQEARFPRQDLDAEATGMAYYVVKARQRQPFAHRHAEAEEVYVILSGAGRMKLDDEVIDVGPLDAIRVSAPVARAFEAGDSSLEVLAFGPRHAGDADLVEDFWAD